MKTLTGITHMLADQTCTCIGWLCDNTGHHPGSHAPAEVFTQQIDLQPGEHIDELTGEIVEGGYAEADIVPDEESE